MTGVDHNVFDVAAPQLRIFGLQRVLARLQIVEQVSPVFCGDGARLDAGGLIARDQRDAFQRLGVEVGEPSAERA